jgi:hypothetical protein
MNSGGLSSMDRARGFYPHGVGSIPTGRAKQSNVANEAGQTALPLPATPTNRPAV